MAFDSISLSSAMRTNLFSLQKTSSQINRTQERLSTGKKVNSALDNPTNFLAAQSHLNRASDLSRLKYGISESIKQMEVTSSGIDGLTSLLSAAKGIVNAALITQNASDIKQFSDSYSELLKQIDSLSKDSTYQGVNLLNNQSRIVELGSHRLSIEGIDASSSGLGLTLPSLLETNVRDTTASSFGFNQKADVAQLGNGNFVAVWTDMNAINNTYDIKVRIVDSSGNLVGQEMLVNSTTTGLQWYPSVTTLSDGGFVVAYSSENKNILGQKFDVDGNKDGTEFTMNSVSSPSLQTPTVAALPNGGFVASWTNTGTWDAEFRIFNGNMTPVTPVVSITGNIAPVSVATFQDGSFVATWGMASGLNYGLQAQLFDSLGNQLSSPMTVITGNNSLLYSKAATSNNGDFLVTWSDEQGNTPVFSSLFNASTSTFSPVQQLSGPLGIPSYPDVAKLNDGTYEVVWRENKGVTLDDLYVVGQTLDANGNKVGSNHLISSTANAVGMPSVEPISSGGYAAFWSAKSGVIGTTGNTVIDFNKLRFLQNVQPD